MFRFAAGLFAFVTVSVGLASGQPLLLQHPTLSATQIAFVYAGDLWTVPRGGGVAQRLTAGIGTMSRPAFSSDGGEIAFTGDYNGNSDVYIIPASGGAPRRLTYHPSPDWVMGWTRDGKQVLFASMRNSYENFNRLFTISRDGGFPAELPLPIAAEGSYSPDGSQLAYVPLDHAFDIWKRYRGGRTSPIWIAQLSDSSVVRIPRDNSNDFNPLWVDDRIFFLSDRMGPISLFSYDTRSKRVTQALKNEGLDFKSASAGPGAIVIEQFGAILLYDLKSGKAHNVDIQVRGDLPELRPHYLNVASRIEDADISPTGLRAVFEARGEILTVPSEKGDIRNLTNTPGVDERSPAWSPNGTRIAYFSDESGEHALYIKDQNGLGEAQKIDLGSPGSFFYFPTWSPDGKKLAYTDKRLNLWYVDLEKKTPVSLIQGPKAMIINEYAGSGGDAMPWHFRQARVGTLVGKRTWGGLVGFFGPGERLMDGGVVTAPSRGFWTPHNAWEVENHGVAPDLEVELDPKAVRDGHDPQLERAVEVVLSDLAKNPIPTHHKPPYPNYHQGATAATASPIN